jgi:hypothetical protein
MDPGEDWAASGSNIALDFDGINDHVLLGNNFFGGSMPVRTSVSLWVRTTQTTDTRVIGVAEPSFTGNFQIIISRLSAGALELIVRDDATALNSGNINSTSVNNGNWNHICATRNGSTTELFLNGVRQTLTYSSQTLGASPITFNRPAALGAVNSSTGVSNFGKLQIDDLILFTATLTQEEIRQIYISGRGDGLVEPDDFIFQPAGFKSAWAARRPTLIGGGLR